ncbi:MAG: chemotaxis protein CheR [Deltaproteobacteria bacterium]|nr:MAG: chemotaxis protein CheR [Deltaproteobacteria bacterium]
MDYKEFLKTTLPHLGLRWRRFRSKSIRKRIISRLQVLALHSWSEYHSYLFDNEEERQQLSGLLTVTISRFWRNAALFEALETTWLPAILDRLPANEPLRIWSAGCASGEEPYSLLILWQESFAGSGRELHLLASDSDSRCLARALQGRYPASSFREMPRHLREKYCTNEGGTFSLPGGFHDRIVWAEHNLISDPPFKGNHLIFCRNLAYTYFTDSLQEKITVGFHRALLPGGLLVLGRKDHLPKGSGGLFRRLQHPIYERLSDNHA